MTGPDDTLVAGPLQTGDVVADRYEIIGLIGMGGMGAVYRARQLAVDRDVALKVIRSAAGGSTGGGVMMRKRFEREAAVVGKLCHPNTVRLFDFGVHGDDMLFMALELIDGRSLVEVLTEGPLHPDRAAFVVGQTLEALVEAHAAGLVHRDLKPGNIMVSHASWDAQTVKVLDFGIAKVRYEAGITDEQLTATGMMLGTVRYMAPEQLDGGEVDARADIYAMGCVLYHLLTGVPPFSGSTLMELVQKKVLEDVPALSGGLAWHPLGRVVRTATARQPADRYADAKTMAEAVRAAVTAAPSPPPAAPTLWLPAACSRPSPSPP